MINGTVTDCGEFVHALGDFHMELDGLIAKNTSTLFHLGDGATLNAKNVHYEG
jgi:hypothetical protein